MADYKNIDTTVIGRSPAYRREKDMVRTENGLEVRSTNTLPTCALGHFIQSSGEIVGQCAVCDAYICANCPSIIRCEIDEDLICQKHFIQKMSGKIVCPRHGIRLMISYITQMIRLVIPCLVAVVRLMILCSKELILTIVRFLKDYKPLFLWLLAVALGLVLLLIFGC